MVAWETGRTWHTEETVDLERDDKEFVCHSNCGTPVNWVECYLSKNMIIFGLIIMCLIKHVSQMPHIRFIITKKSTMKKVTFTRGQNYFLLQRIMFDTGFKLQ